MKLIDCFYREGVIACDTFVCDGQSLLNDYYTMLATRESGHAVSQWKEGIHGPDGDNSHFGESPRYVPEGLLERVLSRPREE